MGKLFELLQIYIIERQWREQFKLHWDKIILWRPYKLRRFPQYDTNSVIISKRFWFIQRLVENDKIDLWEKLFNLTKNDNKKSIILDNNDFSWEDTFLMLLSISDTPIEDLISYLK